MKIYIPKIQTYKLTSYNNIIKDIHNTWINCSGIIHENHFLIDNNNTTLIQFYLTYNNPNVILKLKEYNGNL
jgi:hypothetical protein